MNERTRSWQPDDPRLTRIWRRKDLLAEGHSDRTIAHLMATGVLRRIRYGTYVSGAAWSQCDESARHSILIRAVVKRAQCDMVASHLSALVEWEVPMWDLSPDVVHVTRTDERAGRREAGVVQHLGELRDEDVVQRNGIRLTNPARTALDCACLLDLEHAVTIVGDFLHRKLTTKDELRAMAMFMVKWPGSLQHQLVVDLADERCESVGEHRTLFMCWAQGLPRPVPQYKVYDELGRLFARLDFAWPALGVWLEFDGRIKYQQLLKDGEDVTTVVLREKKREKRIAKLTGWECIRITWADLYKPEVTAMEIRELLSPDTAATG
jgi:hypothetical protein